MSSSVLDMIADIVCPSPAGATPAQGDTGDMGENPRQHWRDSGATPGRQGATNSPESENVARCRPPVAPARAQQPRSKSPLSPLSPAERPEIVARRVFRVLVSMGEDQPQRWVAMLGCTDMADAQRTANNQFGPHRVIQIEAQS